MIVICRSYTRTVDVGVLVGETETVLTGVDVGNKVGVTKSVLVTVGDETTFSTVKLGTSVDVINGLEKVGVEETNTVGDASTSGAGEGCGVDVSGWQPINKNAPIRRHSPLKTSEITPCFLPKFTRRDCQFMRTIIMRNNRLAKR